jgi:hypothetical protein
LPLIIPLTQAEFDRRCTLFHRRRVSMSRGKKNGYSTMSGHGIVIECEYDGEEARIEILKKPVLMSEAVAEARVKGWFKE